MQNFTKNFICALFILFFTYSAEAMMNTDFEERVSMSLSRHAKVCDMALLTK